jgi:clan AA aspartic protease
MIIGTVNPDREATIRLPVSGPDEREQEIEAVIDTGFNGFITLPPAVIMGLDLAFIGRGRAILANGSEDLFDIHEAMVVWDGWSLAVEAEAADTDALIGTSLLNGYDLRIHMVDSGAETITRLAK